MYLFKNVLLNFKKIGCNMFYKIDPSISVMVMVCTFEFLFTYIKVVIKN